MVEIVCAALTATATVLVAIVSKKLTQAQDEIVKKSERRKEENLLLLEVTMACVDLTEVCANALSGGHNNGNVERARNNVEIARKKYVEFQRRVVAEETL